MRMRCIGTMNIMTSSGDIDLNLDHLKLISYRGDDYINVLEFDYSTIFRDVLLCADRKEEDYDIPKTREEFNHSSLWKDLGLYHDKSFKVWLIEKDLTIYYFMTRKQLVEYGFDKGQEMGFNGYTIYNQAAGYIVDMTTEKMWVNEGYSISNEKKANIFEGWPVRSNNGHEMDESYYSNNLVSIFKSYNSEKKPNIQKMDNDVRVYLGQFVDEDGEKLTEKEIEWTLGILLRYLGS